MHSFKITLFGCEVMVERLVSGMILGVALLYPTSSTFLKQPEACLDQLSMNTFSMVSGNFLLSLLNCSPQYLK